MLIFVVVHVLQGLIKATAQDRTANCGSDSESNLHKNQVDVSTNTCDEGTAWGALLLAEDDAACCSVVVNNGPDSPVSFLVPVTIFGVLLVEEMRGC